MKTHCFKKIPFVKKALPVVAAALFALPAIAQEPLTPPALPKWTIQNGKLFDPNGNPFIFRGVTINHTLAPQKTLQAIKDVATAGANAAQIEFPLNPDTFPRTVAAQLRDIIKACKDNKLVCVLEANDAAGYSNYSPISGGTLTSIWTWSDITPVLAGNQENIIIGFGNQHFDNGHPWDSYKERLQLHTSQLLAALPPGYLILVDGDNWSQDTSKGMQALVAHLKGGYSENRVIFSVDMFDAYQDPAKIREYIAEFAALGAPLVIGGFGPTAYRHPHNPARHLPAPVNLPVASVMQYAQEFGVGYLGWSWSGNENPALDLVTNYDANSLTTWGNQLFNDVNGIKATAKVASIYNNTSSSGSSSSISANQNPVAGIESYIVQRACGSVYAELTARSSSDPDGDPLIYEWTIGGDSKVYEGQNLVYFMRGGVIYNFTLTVKDGKGGVGTTSTLLRHEYSDYCISSSSSRTSSSVRSSSSVPDKSSSSVYSSSSVRTTSSSSVRTSSSSSVAQTKAQCSYQIQSQWGNGFTAVIRIKNTSTAAINGWDVNWQYNDGSTITNLWNANLSGVNPYNAKSLSWNSVIQPGQTVEFGFQGSKNSGAASIPAVTGSICQ